MNHYDVKLFLSKTLLMEHYIDANNAIEALEKVVHGAGVEPSASGNFHAVVRCESSGMHVRFDLGCPLEGGL